LELNMTMETAGGVTLKGNPMTLVGPALKAGDPAPDFTVYKALNQPVKGSAYAGQLRFINVVPSLDTGICDLQTKRFNEEAAKIAGVVWLTLSTDTPMAQARWCGAAGVDKIQLLSDYKDHEFGLAYGLYIKELGLLQRGIVILGRDERILYFQRVPEVAQHPDYDAALAALKAAL
jgi:thiol peroxidase